jgi:transposase
LDVKHNEKAKRAGVAVIAIDPRNTSRCCPECGFIDKANRKTQQAFSCTSCGYTTAADFEAARNLRVAAAAPNPGSQAFGLGKSPTLQGGVWSQRDPPPPRPEQGVHRFGGQ